MPKWFSSDGALGRGAVGGDGVPLVVQAADERDSRPASAPRPGRRTRRSSRSVATPAARSCVEQLRGTRSDRVAARGVAQVDPQRCRRGSAKSLDVGDDQPVPRSERVDGGAARSSRGARGRSCRTRRASMRSTHVGLSIDRPRRRRPAGWRCPATKSLRSGTWAITLLACMTSARMPSARSRCGELGAEELDERRHAALRRRPRRTFAAGSMPSTGTPSVDGSGAAGSRRCWPPRRPGRRHPSSSSAVRRPASDFMSATIVVEKLEK